METPEVVVIPATPISSAFLSRFPRATASSTTTTSASPSSHTQSTGSYRSSSEDTAVTIYSMYTDSRDHWAASAKVLALNDVDPGALSRRHSVETISSTVSSARRGTPDNSRRHSSINANRPHSANGRRASRPPSAFQNGHVPEALPNINHRHSIAASSSYRSSEESTSLPYARNSLPPPEEPPTPPPKSPSRPSSKRGTTTAFLLSREITTPQPQPPLALPQPPLSPPAARPPSSPQPRPPPSPQPRPPATPPSQPLAGPLLSTPNHSFVSQPSEGEDADSFHVRSTYAQLDVSGVRGDGYEEGVELTRAKQGGTAYLMSQPQDRGRGPSPDVSPEELQVLASVDRYGFVIQPSAASDRLLLLPASALVKPLSKVASSSSSTSSPTPPALPSIPPTWLTSAARQKELSRVAKWGRMLESDSRDGSGNVLAWRTVPRKERKLRERVYKGIPDAWRSVAWVLLIERFAGATRETEQALTRQYRDTLDQPSSYDIQIDLDVPRTISGHVMFRTRYGTGQRALFHVLHAFSLLCPDCGYVQGMGPIAATLLCYYEPEKVYVVLVHLHRAYAMHNIFSPGFPGLLESIYVQERVMERMLPDVYAAFKKHMISSTSYTTKWYITLFANTVPFQTQLRLWDVFFLEGRDMIVIIAIAILWVFKNELTAESATFETILSLLSSFFVPESEDALMKWIERALSDKTLRADMQMWRGEWQDLVAQGKDRDVLL